MSRKITFAALVALAILVLLMTFGPSRAGGFAEPIMEGQVVPGVEAEGSDLVRCPHRTGKGTKVVRRGHEDALCRDTETRPAPRPQNPPTQCSSLRMEPGTRLATSYIKPEKQCL